MMPRTDHPPTLVLGVDEAAEVHEVAVARRARDEARYRRALEAGLAAALTAGALSPARAAALVAADEPPDDAA